MRAKNLQNFPRRRWVLALLLIAACLPLASCRLLTPGDKSPAAKKPSRSIKLPRFDDFRYEQALEVEKSMADGF